MLLELHVKNLALIEKADVEFGEGLNILTGETGAGKSIIIGSVTMALGGKAPKGSIRPGADYAYIELVFSVTGEEKRKALRELDVEPTEDGLVIISRKLTSARSISRINDETVTMARLSQITGLLLDIHGQHEHQSLLYKSKHLEILDAYVKAATQPVKQTIADRYRIYRSLEEKLRGFDLDAESRIREADFLRFEIEEIETSALKEGEEEELTSVYRRYSHSRRIAECLGAAYEAVEGDWLARALKEVDMSRAMQWMIVKARNDFSAGAFSWESNVRVRKMQPEELETDYNQSIRRLKSILQEIGILSEAGSKDIIRIVRYLIEEDLDIRDITVRELCSRMGQNSKSVEQRIRRAASVGMANLAYRGMDDYADPVFNEYGARLYSLEQIKREMSYIRGKSDGHGNVRVRKFLSGLLVCCKDI